MTSLNLLPMRATRAVCWIAWIGCTLLPVVGRAAGHENFPPISGLAWLSDNMLLGVVDSKTPDGDGKARLGAIAVPKSGDQFHWQNVEFAWPGPLGPSSDLENVSRIPGTPDLLLCESGQDQKYKRIFLVEYRKKQLNLVTYIEWNVPIKNVEGTVVVQLGKRYVFVYAERADGQGSTDICWADLTLKPLKIGKFQNVRFTCPEPTGPQARPVGAMDVDAAGHLYVSSTFDPGDNGPFRSVIWRIGEVKLGEDKQPVVELDAEPHRIADLDKVKVEGIAIREHGGKREIFAASDDENLGGSVRRIPLDP
jgi:hypothetical protein